MLLEKSWAMLNGSYFKTNFGFAYEGFRALTGAPCKVIDHDYWFENIKKNCIQIKTHDEDYLWGRLYKYFKLDYSMTASVSEDGISSL